jgi:NADPH:quinone reductase-like Zn-dependent oxidoreductase
MAKANVLTAFGGPEVLRWQDFDPPEPGAEEIRIEVRAAGVGPTDLVIRAGVLKDVFPAGPGTVLGFEAAGVVEKPGSAVEGVEPGDRVAVMLVAHLGGYGEYAVAPVWSKIPDSVSFAEAAAIPSSAEAAVRTLRELRLGAGETILILGAGGSVGKIATQLALMAGATVIGTVNPGDVESTEALGATAVPYGGDLLAAVRAKTDSVDAVLDAAGKGGLPEAIELAGGPDRVTTLSDPTGAAIGVPVSNPVPPPPRDVLDQAFDLLAAGKLQLRERQEIPFDEASRAHELVEGGARVKPILVAER